jgi:hypothetical protein
MNHPIRLPVLVVGVACLLAACSMDAAFGQGSKGSSKSSSSSRGSNSKSSAKKAPSKVVAKAPKPIDANAAQPKGWLARIKSFFGIGSRRSRAAPAARGSVRGLADAADLDNLANDDGDANPVRASLRRSSSEMSLVDPAEPDGGPRVDPVKPNRPAPDIEPIYSNRGLRISGAGVRNPGEYGEPDSPSKGRRSSGSRQNPYIDVHEPIVAAEVAAAAANVAAGKPYDNLRDLDASTKSLADARQSAGRASSSRQSLSRNSASARQPGASTIDLVSALPLPSAPNSPRNSVNLGASGRSSNGGPPFPPLPLPPLPRGSGAFPDIQ